MRVQGRRNCDRSSCEFNVGRQRWYSLAPFATGRHNFPEPAIERPKAPDLRSPDVRSTSLAGRQVYARVRPRLPERHAGPRAAGDDPAQPRPCRRLNTAASSRAIALAAGRLTRRSGRRRRTRIAPCLLHAGRERGARGDRRVGSQQVGLFPGAKYDGVFAMWYGKARRGPLRRRVQARECRGTAKHGGVLLIAGDDHACKSSTLPHQSEHAFDAAMIRCSTQRECRNSSSWGCTASPCRASRMLRRLQDDLRDGRLLASIAVDPRSRRSRCRAISPFRGGHEHRWPMPARSGTAPAARQDLRALAYCRANGLNRVTIDAPNRGSHHRLREVLPRRPAGAGGLGIDERHAAEIGSASSRWECPATRAQRRARVRPGLDEILVVEEKRQLIEYQMKEQLYNCAMTCAGAHRKYDEHGMGSPSVGMAAAGGGNSPR